MEVIGQTPTKKVYVETWGCQMNVADSEQMLSILKARNYEATSAPEDAELVLLNTCHIREKATHKVLSRLGTLRVLEETHGKRTIAVAGCVAQAEGQKLLDKADNINILLGPGKIEDLPRLIDEHEATRKTAVSIGFNKERAHEEAPVEHKPTASGKVEISRFVNIAQGCDNFCTFCVVPFTRGREISRSMDAIVQEVQSMLDEGAKEITLLGQNVNSYGHDLLRDGLMTATDTGPFVDLLDRVASLPGIERLRFTTSNPHDFSKALADLFAKHSSLGRYIHLPVQAGNDEVLERMKRKVTVAEYWERINWLRSVDPEMALSTDLIVGFPGETDEQFQGTLDLVEQVRYSFIYAFKYSSRKGTAAARFKDQVPEDVKSARLAALNALQDRISHEQAKAEIGRRRQILCHYESRKEPGVYYGRTEQFRLVRVPAERDLIGKMVEVEIVDGNKTALVGRLI